MREASDFQRELMSQRGLDDKHIIPALASSDDEALKQLWAHDAKQFGFEGADQGIVMAEAERSLAAILTQEVLSFEALREMLREVLVCVKHLHDRGVVHADVKPLNVRVRNPHALAHLSPRWRSSQVMRMVNGSFKLIDLDASVRIGAKLGAKSSSAFAPPELLAQLPGRIAVRSFHVRGDTSVADGPFTLLGAAPSYDLFSFGCIFYRALARRQLINVSAAPRRTARNNL